MRCKNPATGEIFENIKDAIKSFCNTKTAQTCYAHGCPFDSKASGSGGCIKWAENNPTEAVRMMGFEPLGEPKNCLNCGHYKQAYVCEMSERTVKNPRREDPPCVLWGKEKDMEKQDKSRLAEVLGVEVGEKIKVNAPFGQTPCWFALEADGYIKNVLSGNLLGGDYLTYAINHPESVIREQRLTEPEIAIMKATGTKWASRNAGAAYVDLWADGPYLATTDQRYYSRNGVIARVHSTRMPSVGPGDCLRLEEQ